VPQALNEAMEKATMFGSFEFNRQESKPRRRIAFDKCPVLEIKDSALLLASAFREIKDIKRETPGSEILIFDLFPCWKSKNGPVPEVFRERWREIKTARCETSFRNLSKRTIADPAALEEPALINNQKFLFKGPLNPLGFFDTKIKTIKNNQSSGVDEKRKVEGRFEKSSKRTIADAWVPRFLEKSSKRTIAGRFG